MHKIGLKLWSINTDAYYIEAQKLFDQGVFNYIELYALPDTLDRLSRWKALKIPYIIHCAHSAHGFNLADRKLEDSNRRIYEQAKRYADELNAPYIIFHGGCDGTIEETARQLAAFHEPRALIENKPMKPLSESAAHECRGYSVDELQTVIKTAKCGFCLDFVHAACAANSMHQEHYSFISHLVDVLHPAMFHLSGFRDLTLLEDDHAHLQNSELHLDQLLKMVDANSIITIETDKDSSDSLEDFSEDVLFLKHFLSTEKKMKDEQDFLKLVSKTFGVPEDSISLSSTPDDIEQWDSMTHLRLVLEVESVYGVRIPMEKIGELKKLMDFYHYVKQQ